MATAAEAIATADIRQAPAVKHDTARELVYHAAVSDDQLRAVITRIMNSLAAGIISGMTHTVLQRWCSHQRRLSVVGGADVNPEDRELISQDVYSPKAGMSRLVLLPLRNTGWGRGLSWPAV